MLGLAMINRLMCLGQSNHLPGPSKCKADVLQFAWTSCAVDHQYPIMGHHQRRTGGPCLQGFFSLSRGCSWSILDLRWQRDVKLKGGDDGPYSAITHLRCVGMGKEINSCLS